MEIWKKVYIDEIETQYSVSDKGRVRNDNSGHIRTVQLTSSGYDSQTLSLGNKKSVTKYTHRLVAETFIDNPENKEQVNHIDGNKLNNEAKNLEWVTQEENMRHCFDSGLSNRNKPIMKYDLSGKHLKTYNSILEASKDINKGYEPIRQASNHLTSQAHGFQWRYVGDETPLKLLKDGDYFRRRGVVQLTLEGEYVREYETVASAYRELGKVDNGDISRVCKGKQKSCYGYTWKYKEDYKDREGNDIVYSDH